MPHRINSWLLTCTLALGTLLIMVGVRPELRSRDHSGPGVALQAVGHTLTWSSATVLAVRMARSSRNTIQQEQRERELAYARARLQSRPGGPSDPA